MLSKNSNGMDFYFFSSGVKFPFTSEALLPCKSVGDLHIAHVVFCSEGF